MLVLDPSITTALSHLSGFTDSQWCETVLTKIIPFLGINTDLLLSRMVFLDLIDSDERETILSQRSTIDRSHNIVSAVKRKGLAGYWRFCDCLVMDRSMSHISKDWNMSHNEYISYVLCRGITLCLHAIQYTHNILYSLIQRLKRLM